MVSRTLCALWLALLVSAPAAGQAVQPKDDDQPSPSSDSRAGVQPVTNDDDAPGLKGARPDKNDQASDDDEDEKGQQSGAIVVTARRLDTARTSIDQGLGATVYELHNETIENRPGGETGSIGSILTQTPGVTLSSSGLNVRGSKAVQVRINGVLIPEAISDPEDRLSSRLAESTRLITGTLPAQFGFAPGGVIALTTKNGLYQHGGQLELFGGNHGTLEPAFEWGGSADATSLFTSASFETGTNRVADVEGPSAREVRHEFGGLAFADHFIDDENRLSLIIGGSHERDRIGKTDLPSGTQESGDTFAVGTFQHSTDAFTIQGALFSGHSRNSARFVQNQKESESSIGTQIDSSIRAGAGSTIRAGLLLTSSSAREWLAQTPGGRSHRNSLGIYVQDEWKLDPHWTINGGVRGDWLKSLSSSPVLQPRASIVWASGSGLTAHTGYARYASAPPLGEEPAGANLPTERDDYFDAGLQQKLGPVTLGVDAYLRAAKDLIVAHKTPGSAFPTDFIISRGQFHGVEFSATYAHGPVTGWANLTLSKSRGHTILDGGSLFPAQTIAAANSRWVDLASDRPLVASGGITWRIGKLDLSGDVLAGSGSVRTLNPSNPNGGRAAAFATFGLAAVYHANLFDQPFDVRADLTDITNTHYMTNDAANLESDWTTFSKGRAIQIGFEQSF